MPDSICVEWRHDSEFLRLVRRRVTYKTSSRRGIDDPHEPMCEVWASLDRKFRDGQILQEQEIGRMMRIIDRRIVNYFKSQGARPFEQLTLSDFDSSKIASLDSVLDSPLQTAIHQEHLRLIEEKLAQMPPRWAEAVRSLLKMPGAVEWSELARISGTTRQNLAKRAKKGLEMLKPLIASFFAESIRDGRVNPKP